MAINRSGNPSSPGLNMREMMDRILELEQKVQKQNSEATDELINLVDNLNNLKIGNQLTTVQAQNLEERIQVLAQRLNIDPNRDIGMGPIDQYGGFFKG